MTPNETIESAVKALEGALTVQKATRESAITAMQYAGVPDEIISGAIAALRQLLATGGWEEISERHKDGEWWLVTFNNRTYVAKWLDNSESIIPWAGWKLPSLWGTPAQFNPTHAMPLPRPPKPDATKGGV